MTLQREEVSEEEQQQEQQQLGAAERWSLAE
jgi:hypothetical protein